jgi:hypothetical protein
LCALYDVASKERFLRHATTLYMDPPTMTRGSRKKHHEEQMPPYIRRLGEGFYGLRALMKFALPLLISISASKAK